MQISKITKGGGRTSVTGRAAAAAVRDKQLKKEKELAAQRVRAAEKMAKAKSTAKKVVAKRTVLQAGQEKKAKAVALQQKKKSVASQRGFGGKGPESVDRSRVGRRVVVKKTDAQRERERKEKLREIERKKQVAAKIKARGAATAAKKAEALRQEYLRAGKTRTF